MSLQRNSRVIQRVPLDTLRLPDLMIKRHPKKQIEKAQKFLAANDQIPLVYVGPDGEILFGEEIWLALNANGVKEVDAVIVNDKSPAELKAIWLALHRIPLDAKIGRSKYPPPPGRIGWAWIQTWDLTGFDASEIDNYLNLDMPKANVEETGSDIPPNRYRARVGTRLHLGIRQSPHRVRQRHRSRIGSSCSELPQCCRLLRGSTV